MKQPRPKTKRIAGQSEFRLHLPKKLRKNDMNGNEIGIQTIRAGGVDNIVAETAEAAIPPAPKMIGCEPPEKINEVRSRNSGNPVPSNSRKIEVFDPLAVNVDVVLRWKPRNPLSDAPLSAMPLIDERRNNRDVCSGHDPNGPLRTDFHCLAPTPKNKQAPYARPAYGSL